MAESSIVNNMLLTHISFNGVFFVIYGQTEPKICESVNEVIRKYAPQLLGGAGVIHNSKTELSIGHCCVVTYIDGVHFVNPNQFYRVIIESINHSNQTAKVQFVDYGYVVEVSISQLRNVNLPTDKNFLNIRPLSNKYILGNVIIEKDQQLEAITWIRNYILFKEVSVTLTASNINAVKLVFESGGKVYDAGQSLAKKGYAKLVSNEEQYYLYQNIMEQNVPHNQLNQPPPVIHGPAMAAPNLMGPNQVSTIKSILAAHGKQNQHQMQHSLPPVAAHPPPTQPYGMIPATTYPSFPPPPPGAHQLPIIPGAAAPPPPVTPYRAPVLNQSGDSLDPGQIYQVHVSFVEEDMTIIVQKKDVVETELVDLMYQINNHPAISFQHTIENGTYCLGRYSGDKKLCRAVVCSVKQDRCQVYYIDYGNIEEIPMSDIYELPEQLGQIKSMANRCVLANIDAVGTITPHIRDTFEEIVGEQVLNLRVMPSDNKKKRIVELTIPNTNKKVIDILIERTKPLAFETIHIPKGDPADVIISHVLNASRFYIQLSSNQNGLDKLMHEVEQYCLLPTSRQSHFTTEELVAGNLPCCAIYPDEGKWYRAMVIDYEPSAQVATVFYVDYGNESLVPITDIIKIPRSLVKFRTQAVECCLNGYSSRRESEDETLRFEKLLELNQYTFKMTIKMHLQGSGKLLVELWDSNSQNVRNILQTMEAEKPLEYTQPEKTIPPCSSTNFVSPPRTTAPNHYERPTRQHDGHDNRNTRQDSYQKKPTSESPPWKHDKYNGDDRNSKFGEDKPRFGGGNRNGDSKPRFGNDERKSKWGGNDNNDFKPRSDSNENGFRKPRQNSGSDKGERNSRYGGGSDAGSGSERFKSDKPSWRSGNREGGSGSRDGRKKKSNEDFTSDNWRSNKSFDSSSKNFPPPKPKLLDGYPSGNKCLTHFQVSPDVDLRVSVTHYSNPAEFWVQSKDTNQTFVTFMNSLQSDYIKRTPVSSFEVNVGDHVIAQFKEDKALYRAEVLETSPEIKVKFVDYGNVSTVDSKRVWHISSEHCEMPIQGLQCSLHNVFPLEENVWSNDCIQHFTQDEYSLTIVSIDDVTKVTQVNLVSITTGKSVANVLTEAGLCTSPSIGQLVEDPVNLKLLLKQILAVHVSYVESSNKFFIHIEPDKPSLIETKLTEALSKPETILIFPEEEISEGKFVLTTTDKEVWYRARIIEKTESGVNVQFIDYGDSAEVNPEDLRFLPESVCVFSPQAVECSLRGIDSTLDEDLEKEFSETLNNIDISILVTEVQDDDRLSVVIYNSEGEHYSKFQVNVPDSIQNTVSKLCDYPVLRQGETVIISHASQDNIYIQKVSDTDGLASFEDVINVHYNTIAKTEMTLEMNQLCAVKSPTYETWYRGKVISVDPQLEILYIDYGNTEVVTDECIRPLNEDHYYPPSFCLQTKLPVTFIKDSYEIFLNDEQHYTVEYHRTDDKEWLVNLIDTNNESIIEKFVLFSGIVTLNEENPFKQHNTLLERLANTSSTGTPCEVTVISYENPNDFSIQLNRDETELEVLQSSLQSYSKRTMEIVGDCQEVCLAKFNDDEQWYRSLVLDSNTYEALFVDYGNKDNVPEIRKLDYNLRQIPQYSLKCNLPIVPVDNNETWSQESIDRFDALINESAPTVTLFHYNAVPYVELYSNDKTISDLLIEEKLATRKLFNSFITHVNSTEDFYVQFIDNTFLDEIFNVLEKIELNLVLNENEISVDDIIGAKYHLDQTWYRAEVIKKIEQEDEATKIEVLFIDYGNTSSVTEFRKLPKSISKIPPLAKKCSLTLPADIKSWPESSNDKLIELSAEGATEFGVKFINFDKNLVELFNSSNENIETILLEPPALKNYLLTHINSANDFYLQEEDDKNVISVTDQIVNLENEEQYNDFNINEIIAAKFEEDGLWYRAKVLSKTETEIEVLFIDYGNTSKTTEFRKLNESLKEFKPCSIHSKLILPDDVEEGMTEYNLKANEKFIELSDCGNTIYTCEFIEKDENDVNLVDLYIADDRVCDLLKESLELGTDDVTRQDNEPEVKENIKPTIPELTPVQTPITTESDKCTIGWINSPNDFYILELDDGTLDTITEIIANVEDKPSVDVTIGDIAAAKFIDDDLWYRAKVISKLEEEGDTYNVLFIDYGNSSTASQFRALPDQLILTKLPACAKHVKLLLPGNLNTWPTTAEVKLNEILSNGDVLTVEMVDEIEDGISTVELFLNKKTVSHIIADFDESNVAITNKEPIAASLEPIIENTTEMITDLTIEDSWDNVEDLTEQVKQVTVTDDAVQSKEPATKSNLRDMVSESQNVFVITHVNSPSDFYLLIEPSASIEIGKSLKSAGDFERVEHIILFSNYAAFNSQEDAWHRAELMDLDYFKNVDSPTCIIRYIDFGSTDAVSLDELRELPDHIRERPSVTQNCELQTSDECIIWSDAAINKLLDLSITGRFHVEFVNNEDPRSVILKTLDGINVNELLVKLNEDTSNHHSGNNEDLEAKKDDLNETFNSDVPNKNLLNQNVIITHYVDPNEFYLQIIKDNPILESVNNLLPGLKDVNTSDVELNELYAGLDKDSKKWYRVKVIERNDETPESYSVKFIDYGYTKSCNEFKQLSEDLKCISSLSFLCCLNDKLIADWSNELNNEFKKFIAGGNDLIVTNFIESENDKPHVIELTIKVNNVLKIISKNMFNKEKNNEHKENVEETENEEDTNEVVEKKEEIKDKDSKEEAENKDANEVIEKKEGSEEEKK